MSKIRDYIAAHRKALLAAVTAVAVLLFDSETAQIISGAVGTLLTLLVPNDPAAVGRIYGAG